MATMYTTDDLFGSSATTSAESIWVDDDWVNPENALTNLDTAAYIVSPTYDSGDRSYLLRISGFDFNYINDNAIITGIRVAVKGRYANGTVSIGHVQLIGTDGAVYGDNKASTYVPFATTNDIYYFGGVGDLWGLTMTPTILKNSNFGVAIGCISTGLNSDVAIEWVRMTVRYWQDAPNPLFGRTP